MQRLNSEASQGNDREEEWATPSERVLSLKAMANNSTFRSESIRNFQGGQNAIQNLNLQDEIMEDKEDEESEADLSPKRKGQVSQEDLEHIIEEAQRLHDPDSIPILKYEALKQPEDEEGDNVNEGGASMEKNLFQNSQQLGFIPLEEEKAFTYDTVEPVICSDNVMRLVCTGHDNQCQKLKVVEVQQTGDNNRAGKRVVSQEQQFVLKRKQTMQGEKTDVMRETISEIISSNSNVVSVDDFCFYIVVYFDESLEIVQQNLVNINEKDSRRKWGVHDNTSENKLAKLNYICFVQDFSGTLGIKTVDDFWDHQLIAFSKDNNNETWSIRKLGDLSIEVINIKADKFSLWGLYIFKPPQDEDDDKPQDKKIVLWNQWTNKKKIYQEIQVSNTKSKSVTSQGVPQSVADECFGYLEDNYTSQEYRHQFVELHRENYKNSRSLFRDEDKLQEFLTKSIGKTADVKNSKMIMLVLNTVLRKYIMIVTKHLQDHPFDLMSDTPENKSNKEVLLSGDSLVEGEAGKFQGLPEIERTEGQGHLFSWVSEEMEQTKKPETQTLIKRPLLVGFDNFYILKTDIYESKSSKDKARKIARVDTKMVLDVDEGNLQSKLSAKVELSALTQIFDLKQDYMLPFDTRVFKAEVVQVRKGIFYFWELELVHPENQELTKNIPITVTKMSDPMNFSACKSSPLEQRLCDDVNPMIEDKKGKGNKVGNQGNNPDSKYGMLVQHFSVMIGNNHVARVFEIRVEWKRIDDYKNQEIDNWEVSQSKYKNQVGLQIFKDSFLADHKEYYKAEFENGDNNSVFRGNQVSQATIFSKDQIQEIVPLFENNVINGFQVKINGSFYSFPRPNQQTFQVFQFHNKFTSSRYTKLMEPEVEISDNSSQASMESQRGPKEMSKVMAIVCQTHLQERWLNVFTSSLEKQMIFKRNERTLLNMVPTRTEFEILSDPDNKIWLLRPEERYQGQSRLTYNMMQVGSLPSKQQQQAIKDEIIQIILGCKEPEGGDDMIEKVVQEERIQKSLFHEILFACGENEKVKNLMKKDYNLPKMMDLSLDLDLVNPLSRCYETDAGQTIKELLLSYFSQRLNTEFNQQILNTTLNILKDDQGHMEAMVTMFCDVNPDTPTPNIAFELQEHQIEIKGNWEFNKMEINEDQLKMYHFTSTFAEIELSTDQVLKERLEEQHSKLIRFWTNLSDKISRAKFSFSNRFPVLSRFFSGIVGMFVSTRSKYANLEKLKHFFFNTQDILFGEKLRLEKPEDYDEESIDNQFFISQLQNSFMEQYFLEIPKSSFALCLIDQEYQGSQTVFLILFWLFVVCQIFFWLQISAVTGQNGFILNTIQLVFQIIFIMVEFIQMIHRFPEYFVDLYNINDIMHFLLFIGYYIERYYNPGDTVPGSRQILDKHLTDQVRQTMLNLGLLLSGYIKLRQYGTVYLNFDFAMSLITRTFSTVAPFLFQFLFLIYIFGQAFIVLGINPILPYEKPGQFLDPQETTILSYIIFWQNMFRYQIGDIMEPDFPYWSEWGVIEAEMMIWIVYALLIFMMFVMNIIMLNFLIAIISEVYERSNNEKIPTSYMNKSSLNNEMSLFQLYLNRMTIKPFIISGEAEIVMEDGQEWQGLTEEIKKNVIKSQAQQQKVFKALHNETLQQMMRFQNMMERQMKLQEQATLQIQKKLNQMHPPQ